MFEEFKPVSKVEWLARIGEDLKGRPLSELVAGFGEVSLSPFHHADDRGGRLPVVLPLTRSWEIGEDIEVSDDFIKTNRRLLRALEGGVNAPRLILNKNIAYSSLAIILEGVEPDRVSLQFYLTHRKANPGSLLAHFHKFVLLHRIDVKNIRAGLDWSPGAVVGPADVANLFERVGQSGMEIRLPTVNGLHFFSDKKPVVELERVVSLGERFLHRYATEKYPPAFINKHLQFSVAVGKNYFLNIAKLRALRLLWANVMKAYGMGGPMPPVAVHFAEGEQTDDPHTNMIAATTQAMSAVTGGADRLTVLPADAYSGEVSGFSRRIARNVQHILQLESHFDQVADPVAGSYFVEKLTRVLCEKAWAAFIEN
ncbi:MAG TPA: hypothetical protein ENJ20_00345 [Bacteroidetes bacterium]|nr:hypothetical protein [Bacteroidota bacterium]